MLAKSVSGVELARELISVLSVTYGIKCNMLIAAMRDGASVNSVAIRTVKVVYPLLIDVRCFSHTIDRVGNHFETPLSGSVYSLTAPRPDCSGGQQEYAQLPGGRVSGRLYGSTSLT